MFSNMFIQVNRLKSEVFSPFDLSSNYLKEMQHKLGL